MNPSLASRFHILPFIPILFLGLFHGLTVAAPGFYNAEFLVDRGLTAETLGFVYVVASICSIILFLILPKLLERYGVHATMRSFTVLFCASAVGLAYLTSLSFTVVAFIIFIALSVPIYSLVDILIEWKTGLAENTTGRVRGLYLVSVNLAYVLGPLLAGFLVINYSFSYLYLFAALMCVPFLIIAHRTMRTFHDPVYPQITFGYIFREIFNNGMVSITLSIQFLLRLVYVVGLLYFALYFYNQLGFQLDTIGVMLSISIIPFVLIQFPLGILDDTLFGEKKFLIAGFTLLCIGMFAISFIPASILLATIALSIMHTGAAIIEVMAESYFFKHIKSQDDAHIVAFRMLIPLAYIIGPLLGSIFLLFFPLSGIFATVAIISTLGIPLALSLKDTR
jgi:MFS family permease